MLSQNAAHAQPSVYVDEWTIPADMLDEASGCNSVADMLVRAARNAPQAGVHWIADGGTKHTYQSYRSLLAEVRHLLGGMRTLPLSPGERVILLLERPSDFIPAFWACVLGGFIPCPVAAKSVDSELWLAQLRHLDGLLDGPLVITTEAMRTARPFVAGMRVVTVGELANGPSAMEFYKAQRDELAMLVLTSGSTGNSKAVMLTHANLLASMAAKAEVHALTPKDVTLNWVSFDHVAALLECHMLPLFVGATQLQSPSQPILSAPQRFLELIFEYGVTMTFAPNFLLGQINRAIGSAGVSPELDLSCLRQIISGGEAIVAATATTFLDALAPYGLARGAVWPAFGMTETCAGSIYSREFPDGDAGLDFASLGKPVRGLELRIVDDNDVLLGEGEVGELQVRGPMVLRGYFNNPQATAEAFTVDGWFRTGDRGTLKQSRLSLAGRSKDSIIVNGVNYYSHELEAVIERLDGLEKTFTAAFPTRSPENDTEELVVVFTPSAAAKDAADLHRLLVAIRNTVLIHWGFRPALILPLPTHEIPKTSLGKIQRTQLRKRLEAGQLAEYSRHVDELMAHRPAEMVAPQGAEEEALAQIFAEIFGIAPQRIGATANFFELGGTSLEILVLKARIEERFNKRGLSFADILRGSTVRELAQSLAADAPAAYNPIVSLQRTGSGTPLFCVHPGVGEVLVFVNLAKYFLDERPVYALRARGFAAGDTPFTSFAEMVQSYVAAIRAAQPTGPYALAGYSFGGVVAFEIAKTLERAGERVAFLGVINVPPDIAASRQSIDFVYTAVNLAFLLSLLTHEQTHDLPDKLRAAYPRDEIVPQLFAMAPARRLAELDLDLTRFTRWVEIAFSLVELGRTYVPSGSVEAIDVFYATPPVRYRDLPRSAWLKDKLQRWDNFSRTAVDYIEVPGEHQTVLGKHIADFQAILSQRLARALTE